MSAYDWQNRLKEIYDKAVTLYQSGQRDDSTFFTSEEVADLAAIGLRPINVYDFAEDFVASQEPGWETFLLIASARRDYFYYVQGRQASDKQLNPDDLPPKTAEFDGIEWLPRIIPKAQCFLQGSLCHDIMYSCGGDRRFLKKHDIHAADFLRTVWETMGDPAAIKRRLNIK